MSPRYTSIPPTVIRFPPGFAGVATAACGAAFCDPAAAAPGVEHVVDRVADLRVGRIGHAAASRHAAMPPDRGANQVVEAILQPRRPGSPVADLGRAALAALVALGALRCDDLLAAALGSHVLRADRLHPPPARLVDHVRDRARDFQIGEIGTAAVCRHLPDALERVLGEAGETLRSAFLPCLPVADLRRALCPRPVARDADRVDHVLAAPPALRDRVLRHEWRGESNCPYKPHQPSCGQDSRGTPIDARCGVHERLLGDQALHRNQTNYHQANSLSHLPC